VIGSGTGHFALPYVRRSEVTPRNSNGVPQFATNLIVYVPLFRGPEAIRDLQTQLAETGRRLDHTRPDIGVPVARVIVPGLRHFYRRFAPGRLYDIPVKLGLLDRPRSEAELNPIGPP
jgi:hypothetical protein